MTLGLSSMRIDMWQVSCTCLASLARSNRTITDTPFAPFRSIGIFAGEVPLFKTGRRGGPRGRPWACFAVWHTCRDHGAAPRPVSTAVCCRWSVVHRKRTTRRLKARSHLWHNGARFPTLCFHRYSRMHLQITVVRSQKPGVRMSFVASAYSLCSSFLGYGHG